MNPAPPSRPVEVCRRHVAGSIKRLIVHTAETGWCVLEEQDNRVVRETVCSDWHRVERARWLFDLDTPSDQGWRRA
ncbi:MAG: hypothetical protein GEU99_00460 [Luteitalea sp.]|nr:hypothetical protein [Luteitalea sp.]